MILSQSIIPRYYHPDAGDGGGAPLPDDGAQSPDHSLPDDIDDLLYIAGRVSEKWIANPAITMLDMDPRRFGRLVADMRQQLGSRKAVGGQRPSQTLSLETLDAEADEGVKKVKAYLVGKYEDEDIARAQYARFGISNESSNYRLPTDRQDRLTALDLMIAAIDADGFGNKEYGNTFWEDFKQRYQTALGAASDTDSNVSNTLATLDVLEQEVRDVLTGLRFILRGNYLKTYQQVWRAWGFQAEDF